jgi:hypothetical protein
MRKDIDRSPLEYDMVRDILDDLLLARSQLGMVGMGFTPVDTEPKPATVTLVVTEEWVKRAKAMMDGLGEHEVGGGVDVVWVLISKALAGVRKEGDA